MTTKVPDSANVPVRPSKTQPDSADEEEDTTLEDERIRAEQEKLAQEQERERAEKARKKVEAQKRAKDAATAAEAERKKRKEAAAAAAARVSPPPAPCVPSLFIHAGVQHNSLHSVGRQRDQRQNLMGVQAQVGRLLRITVSTGVSPLV